MVDAAERIRVRAVMHITGMSKRTVELKSARGEIPTAAKLDGHWSYDESAIRRWIKQEEARACQTTSTKEMAHGTPALNSVGATLENRYIRALR